MGATTVAAALSDFQAISQTVGTLKGGTVGADNLDDELSSDLESQEAVVDKPVTAIVIGRSPWKNVCQLLGTLSKFFENRRRSRHQYRA